MTKSDIKVLVVDDEPDIREILHFNLTKEGYNVYKAKNGKEALEKAGEIKPDIILLDIMMPEMDGVIVCKHLRADPELDNTIIAFLTARGEEFTEIAALDSGGDDFINKPIKPRVLVSRVNALLRRSIGGKIKEDQKVLEIGGIKIDPQQFLVWKKDKSIDLPKKEFKILQLLMSKAGKVFTREEIFQKIWGPEVIVGSRTIDVHIRKLREKIGEKRIKTVKGIGYKFKE